MNASFLVSFLSQTAILFPTFLLLFTVRGFFQALASALAGDAGPRENGFLTLNPLAHIDIYGTLILSAVFAGFSRFEGAGSTLITVILMTLVVLFGARPYHSVVIDPSQFRWPRVGIAMTTLAASVGYLMLALLGMYALVWGSLLIAPTSGVFQVGRLIAESVITWSMTWAVISLVPLPPFDAAALLPVVFGDIGQDIYDALEPYGFFIFIGLFWLPGVSHVFRAALGFCQFYLYEMLMHLVWIPDFIKAF